MTTLATAIKWLETNTAFSVTESTKVPGAYLLLRCTFTNIQPYGDYSEKELLDFIKRIRWQDGKPCSHTGCLHHITHPCEGCGRIGGRFPEDIE